MDELLYKQKDFNRNEKRMTMCFVFLVMLMLGCQIAIELLDQKWKKGEKQHHEVERWVYLGPIIFNMAALVLSETILEWVLAREIKVQHGHHRWFLRV